MTDVTAETRKVQKESRQAEGTARPRNCPRYLEAAEKWER